MHKDITQLNKKSALRTYVQTLKSLFRNKAFAGCKRKANNWDRLRPLTLYGRIALGPGESYSSFQKGETLLLCTRKVFHS